eukprot:24482_1
MFIYKTWIRYYTIRLECDDLTYIHNETNLGVAFDNSDWEHSGGEKVNLEQFQQMSIQNCIFNNIIHCCMEIKSNEMFREENINIVTFLFDIVPIIYHFI